MRTNKLPKENNSCEFPCHSEMAYLGRFRGDSLAHFRGETATVEIYTHLTAVNNNPFFSTSS